VIHFAECESRIGPGFCRRRNGPTNLFGDSIWRKGRVRGSGHSGEAVVSRGRTSSGCRPTGYFWMRVSKRAMREIRVNQRRDLIVTPGSTRCIMDRRYMLALRPRAVRIKLRVVRLGLLKGGKQTLSKRCLHHDNWDFRCFCHQCGSGSSS